MDRKCIKRIICVGQEPGLEADSPVTNYSSEYDDGVEFPGRNFPPFPPYDPNLDSWVSAACDGVYRCTSHISQQDADDCAAALAMACILDRHPPDDPTPFCISNPTACIPPTTGLYTNDQQSANYTCPDGTVFTWTVNAGTIISTSKSLANQIALALAQKRVSERFICFNSIQESACVGEEYSQTIQASGLDLYTMEIVSGAIPDGMVSSPGVSEITISGTPTGIGVFYFTVRATGVTTDAVSERTYIISAIEIVTESVLDEGVVGQAYSKQLDGAGGFAPYTFAITAGTLPDGLSMDDSGLISGTPTEAVNDLFSVSMTDSSGGTCSRIFSLKVNCMIATVSLPNGEDGTAYSQTLDVDGFTGAVTWSIVSGALPSGLSLNASTGEISGDPDTAETQVFTVQAQQGEFSCEKELSITIDPGSDCADWTTTSWSEIPFSINATHTETWSYAGDSFYGKFTAQQTGMNPTQTQVQLIGSVVINTTAPCCCRLSLVVTRGQGAPNLDERMYAQAGSTYGGSEYWVLSNVECITGDHDFQLPDTGGSDLTVYFTVSMTAASDDGILYSIEVDGTLSSIPCP